MVKTVNSIEEVRWMEFIATDPGEKQLEDTIRNHPKAVYAFIHVLDVADRSNRVNLLLELLEDFAKAEKERIKLDYLWRKPEKEEG